MRLRVVFGVTIGLIAGVLVGYVAAVTPWTALFKSGSKVTVTSPHSTTTSAPTPRSHGENPCSFSSPPYVHPKIIEDLMTWISDRGDQVVAINLLEAQDSNRYSGEVVVREVPGKGPLVCVCSEKEEFAYQHIGRTTSGIHVLCTSDWRGGSDVFKNLLLLRIEDDKGLAVDWGRQSVHLSRRRLLLRKLGEIGLGDRWAGELKVKGNELFIGTDEGWFSRSVGKGGGPLSRKEHLLRIDLR